MAHQIGVVRKASHSKRTFDEIVAEATNEEKCPPKNPTFQTESRTKTQLTNWKQWSRKLRIASEPQEKTIYSLVWKKAKKTQPSIPKIFNVKEKLELSWCHKNLGPSYWSGTKCITFRRKRHYSLLEREKRKVIFLSPNDQNETRTKI